MMGLPAGVAKTPIFTQFILVKLTAENIIQKAKHPILNSTSVSAYFSTTTSTTPNRMLKTGGNALRSAHQSLLLAQWDNSM